MTVSYLGIHREDRYHVRDDEEREVTEEVDSLEGGGGGE